MRGQEHRGKERFYRWLAWHLPKRLAYWTFIRVATNQPTFAPEQPVVEALRQWQDAEVREKRDG